METMKCLRILMNKGAHVLARNDAAEWLGMYGHSNNIVISALLAQVEDKNSLVQFAVAMALGDIGRARNKIILALQISDIQQLQNNDDWHVRWMSSRSLEKLQ